MSLFQAFVMWLCTMASPDSSPCASATDVQQTQTCDVQSSGSTGPADCDCPAGSADIDSDIDSGDNIYNGF